MAAEHYWVMLAIEYILYPRERRSDYPFVLPYLEIMNRVMKVKSMIKKIVMWNGRHNFGVGVVLKIFNNNVIRWLYFLNLRCSTGLGWKGDGNLSPPFDKLGVAAAHIFKVALRVN